MSHYTYYIQEAPCPILNPITLYIHVHWYVTKKKTPTNSTLKMQKQEFLSKRCYIFISFNSYSNLSKVSYFALIGYKCSVPGANLTKKMLVILVNDLLLNLEDLIPAGNRKRSQQIKKTTKIK